LPGDRDLGAAVGGLDHLLADRGIADLALGPVAAGELAKAGQGDRAPGGDLAGDDLGQRLEGPAGGGLVQTGRLGDGGVTSWDLVMGFWAMLDAPEGLSVRQ
jgi:hypothetical protein